MAALAVQCRSDIMKMLLQVKVCNAYYGHVIAHGAAGYQYVAYF